MLVAAAFAPHPPVIVPELAAGAAAELDTLRSACDDAVRRMLASGPDRVLVLGAGPPGSWDESDTGSLAGYGVPLTVPLGVGPTRGPWPSPSEASMPLSVTIGAWLLGRSGYAGPRHAVTVPAGATDAELAGRAARVLGSGGVERPTPGAAGWSGAGERIGLLVMGDGSARRSTAAPGFLDERAAGFDAGVAAALRAGDPAGLRALDPVLGAELLAAGVPAWRLAGHLAGEQRYRAGLLHDEAPYGVGYLVAAWLA